ncbi:MAG: hypothetical protein Q4D71_14765, partial [Oscillospiraceae bacterium]|nr:hypothetical protein [Oscillospiraceae bacterium]
WKKSTDADSYRIYWRTVPGKNKKYQYSGKTASKSGTIDIKKASTTKYVFKIKEKDRKVKYRFNIVAIKDGVESPKLSKGITDSAVQLMTLKVTLKARSGGYQLKSHDKGKTVTYRKLKAGD